MTQYVSKYFWLFKILNNCNLVGRSSSEQSQIFQELIPIYKKHLDDLLQTSE